MKNTLSKITVLYVEDDSELRKQFGEILELMLKKVIPAKKWNRCIRYF